MSFELSDGTKAMLAEHHIYFCNHRKTCTEGRKLIYKFADIPTNTILQPVLMSVGEEPKNPSPEIVVKEANPDWTDGKIGRFLEKMHSPRGDAERNEYREMRRKSPGAREYDNKSMSRSAAIAHNERAKKEYSETRKSPSVSSVDSLHSQDALMTPVSFNRYDHNIDLNVKKLCACPKCLLKESGSTAHCHLQEAKDKNQRILYLRRKETSQTTGTFGELSGFGDNTVLYTIEPPWNENTIGKSCIPCGVYNCSIVDSPKYGKTYWLSNTGKRTEILFHHGQWYNPADTRPFTKGCILIGINKHQKVRSGTRTGFTNDDSEDACDLLERRMGGNPFVLYIRWTLSGGTCPYPPPTGLNNILPC